MDRKEFLQKLSLCAFGTSTLAALLSFISPNYLDSIIVKPNDSRLKSGNGPQLSQEITPRHRNIK